MLIKGVIPCQRFQSIQRAPAGSLRADGVGAGAGPMLAVISPGNCQKQDFQDYWIFRMARRKGQATQSGQCHDPANPDADDTTVESGGAREVGVAANSLPLYCHRHNLRLHSPMRVVVCAWRVLRLGDG